MQVNVVRMQHVLQRSAARIKHMLQISVSREKCALGKTYTEKDYNQGFRMLCGLGSRFLHPREL